MSLSQVARLAMRIENESFQRAPWCSASTADWVAWGEEAQGEVRDQLREAISAVVYELASEGLSAHQLASVILTNLSFGEITP